MTRIPGLLPRSLSVPRLIPSLALACTLSFWSLPAQGAPGDDATAPTDTGAAAPADTGTGAATPKPRTQRPAARPAPRRTPAADSDATATPSDAATPPAAASTPAAPAAPQITGNQKLADDVDDFWHYGKIARYDVAAAYGNRILSRPEPPLDVLHAFQSVASEHGDQLDDWILRWEGIDASNMKGVTAKIQQLLDKGRRQERQDPKYIEANIRGLSQGPRAYAIHLSRLRQVGELAVPMMLDYLRDPAKIEFHDSIRQALVDLGRPILNPLLAATETKDDTLELTLIDTLEHIGYDAAVPYLGRIAMDRKHPNLSQAASAAIRRMGADPNANVADAFYRLSEKFYYNTAAIQADMKEPSAYMWYWVDTGLTYKTVPPAIFSDLMSMREAEYSLQLGPGSRDALSLWLSADNKLEVDLPAGATVSVFAKNRPSANYYNVYAGVQYLNAALTRALDDHNAPVALKLITSLAQIVGPSSQGSGARLDPLVQAMRYPDRLVRFEAAFALASGMPTRPFPGHERVAPLLAEAVSQNGGANILVIAPSQADEQKLDAELKQYGVASGTNPQQAFTNAVKLPAIDVIVMPETLGNESIDRVYQLANDNPRMERVAKVIILSNGVSPWAQRAIADPLTVVTQAKDAAGLAKAVETARKRAGGLPLDQKVATTYAVRAAQLLQRLAEGRVQAFDLTVTEPTLLASLNDKRPEVAKAVGDALAYMNSPLIQPSILSAALATTTSDDARIGLLKSLAKNAKFYGNHLEEAQLNDLQKQVDTATNLEVRTAAAEARGALNLPADQAKALIIQQARH